MTQKVTTCLDPSSYNFVLNNMYIWYCWLNMPVIIAKW